MFTGIIQEVGKLIDADYTGATARLRIEAPRTCHSAELGDSICVNGVCLTVTRLDSTQFIADLSSETLNRSSFKRIRSGEALNIEPALRPMDRLGGHIVAGHVDGIGVVEEISEEGEFWRLAVRYPEDLSRYIALKGSLAVDGISLTVAALHSNTAEFAVIPFTIQQTNLRIRRVGEIVNLEADMLARYVEQLMTASDLARESGLTIEKLQKYGFSIE